MKSDTSVDKYAEETFGNDSEHVQASDPVGLFESVKAVMLDERKYAMNGIDFHLKDIRTRAATLRTLVSNIDELLTQLDEAIDAGEPEEMWSDLAEKQSFPDWFHHVEHALADLRTAYRCYDRNATKLHLLRHIGYESGFSEILEQ